jgi:hypothetical protein
MYKIFKSLTSVLYKTEILKIMNEKKMLSAEAEVISTLILKIIGL